MLKIYALALAAAAITLVVVASPRAPSTTDSVKRLAENSLSAKDRAALETAGARESIAEILDFVDERCTEDHQQIVDLALSAQKEISRSGISINACILLSECAGTLPVDSRGNSFASVASSFAEARIHSKTDKDAGLIVKAKLDTAWNHRAPDAPLDATGLAERMMNHVPADGQLR